MSKWKMVRLGDVALINPSKKDMPELSKNESVGFLSMDAVSNSGEIIRIDTRILSDVQKGFTYFENGDILFAKITPCMENGKGAIVSNMPNKVGFGSTEFHVVRPVHESINTEYLNYFLKNPVFRDEAGKYMTGSAGQKRVPSTYLNNVKIPLPPLDEQKRIADVLDKASELIKKRKEQIRLMDELAKSLFIEMFGDPVENPMGWDIKPFTTAAIIDTNMTTDFEKYANYPHIGIESIERDSGRILNYNLVKDDHLSSGKYTFGKQHIIYSKIRPNLNKVALPNFDGLCSADAYPILPKDTANKFYLAYILRSKHFLDYILKHSDRTNIPKANKKQLEGYKLPLPPISLQNEFADRIDAIEQQKALLQDGLAKMETAYKALMQEYFG